MEKLEIFAGPCVIENSDLVLEVADFLKSTFEGLPVKFSFKASFDKANRTSLDSFRGPGLQEGLKILQKVKDEIGVEVLTDIHLPEQAKAVSEVADVVQIPAFLCRQTDMIVAASKAVKENGGRVNIKKGQFLSPYEASKIVEKAQSIVDKKHILLTERGSSFGYQTLVVDMASFSIMKSFGVKAIHDATHCVQRPGALGDQTGGNRAAIFPLAKAAVAAGADGVFFECHPRPDKALSDSATALPLSEVKTLVEKLVAIYEAANR